MTLLDYLPSLHNAAAARIDPAIWPLTTTVDDLGRLCVGDVSLTDIADEFRTPTYVLDEPTPATAAALSRQYRRRDPLSAKSLLTTDIARWVAQEGAGLDVSSGGELAIALAGGMDPARIVLHGNAKPVDELSDAAAVGIGRIVVDSPMEIAYLSCVARRPQPVLIRVTPGIDIGGHPAVVTGVDDQKFGFALTDGCAIAAAQRILHQPALELVGLHCHIGSQVTDATLYGEVIRRMIATMADIRHARHRPVRTQHRWRTWCALRQR